MCCNHDVILVGHVWFSLQNRKTLQVWMPDEPKTTSSSARSQSMRWNDTPSSPPSSTASSAAAVLAPDDTQSASTSGRQAGTDAGTQQGPPSWWDPPPTIHVDKRYKDQVWGLSAYGSVATGNNANLWYHRLLLKCTLPQKYTCNGSSTKALGPIML